jgi:hypothetical protein
MSDLRVAMPDRAEGANHVVNPRGIAPPNAALPLERNELLLYLDKVCLEKGELHTGGL